MAAEPVRLRTEDGGWENQQGNGSGAALVEVANEAAIDVNVANEAAISVDVAAYDIEAEGVKTVAATATPEALVASSTPCKRVWVGAPVDDDGVAVNTKVVRISGAGTASVGYAVLTTDHKGFYIPIADAADLTVRVAVNGEGISYVAFG